MRIRIGAVGVLGLATTITGCATAPMQYALAPSKSQEDYRAAAAACTQANPQTEGFIFGPAILVLPVVAATAGHNYGQRKNFRRCMEAQGYRCLNNCPDLDETAGAETPDVAPNATPSVSPSTSASIAPRADSYAPSNDELQLERRKVIDAIEETNIGHYDKWLVLNEGKMGVFATGSKGIFFKTYCMGYTWGASEIEASKARAISQCGTKGCDNCAVLVERH